MLGTGGRGRDAGEVLDALRRRLARTSEELHAEELRSRFVPDEGRTSIGSVPARGAIRVRGEVAGLQVVPRAGAPSLEVTVEDGTGRLVLVFTGRRRVGGMDPGRALEVEGTAGRERGRLVVMNPAYTLLR